MNIYLTSVLSLMSALLAAIASYVFARRSALEQHNRNIAKDAYIDLIQAITDIASAQKTGDAAAESEAFPQLLNAKTRLSLFGTPAAVKAYADFERGGATLDSRERQVRWISTLLEIRAASQRNRPRFSDVAVLLLGMDLQPDGSGESIHQTEDEQPQRLSVSLRGDKLGRECLDKALLELRSVVARNYTILVKGGSAPGAATADAAMLIAMSRTLSTAPPETIEKLRAEKILAI